MFRLSPSQKKKNITSKVICFRRQYSCCSSLQRNIILEEITFITSCSASPAPRELFILGRECWGMCPVPPEPRPPRDVSHSSITLTSLDCHRTLLPHNLPRHVIRICQCHGLPSRGWQIEHVIRLQDKDFSSVPSRSETFIPRWTILEFTKDVVRLITDFISSGW